LRKRVYYIGNFRYPDGNAAGKRVYSNTLLLKSMGFEVTIVGKADKQYEQKNDSFVFYAGNSIIDFVFPSKNLKIVKNLIEKNGNKQTKDYVIYYGTPTNSLFIKSLISYCRQKNITILSDCVDLLSIQTKNPIFNTVKRIDDFYIKKILNKKVDGLIVISTYLENMYKRICPNVPSLVLPPLTVKSNLFIDNNVESNRLKLIYAGQLFRKNEKNKNPQRLKDRVDIVFESLIELKNLNVDFIFNVFGFTKDEYLNALPNQTRIINFLCDNICFHGHRENEYVQKYVAESDFSILIRDIKIETEAGFPTKASESISLGTPVITTKTSDLSRYIIDGKHGFFVENNGDSLSEMLINLSKLTKEQKQFIKNQCLESNLFDYKNFIDVFTIFIKKIDLE
jgi:glycosyltransferase involved in cell wall biosynthesis